MQKECDNAKPQYLFSPLLWLKILSPGGDNRFVDASPSSHGPEINMVLNFVYYDMKSNKSYKSSAVFHSPLSIVICIDNSVRNCADIYLVDVISVPSLYINRRISIPKQLFCKTIIILTYNK